MAWRGLRAAEAALESARGEAADAARRRLDLEDLVARIDQLAPSAGEPDALRAERERLRHLDELAAAAGAAAELLSPADGEGARELTASAAQEVAGVTAFAPELSGVAASLDDIAIRIQDAAAELRGHLAGLEADPARLEHVEARLEAFAQLERRYAAPLAEVVESAGAARRALERLESSTAELARLESEAEAAAEAARDCAGRLTAARVAAAEPFARAVEAELADLGMAQAVFTVRVEEAEIGPRGADRAVLELAATPTLAAGPVAETASGGELSRIALAIRVAARAGGGPGILLLDEVDAGHRRPDGAGRRRQAGRAGRGRSASGHHPPAPDRPRGRRAFPGREAGGRRGGDGGQARRGGRGGGAGADAGRRPGRRGCAPARGGAALVTPESPVGSDPDVCSGARSAR